MNLRSSDPASTDPTAMDHAACCGNGHRGGRIHCGRSREAGGRGRHAHRRHLANPHWGRHWHLPPVSHIIHCSAWSVYKCSCGTTTANHKIQEKPTLMSGARGQQSGNQIRVRVAWYQCTAPQLPFRPVPGHMDTGHLFLGLVYRSLIS